MNYNDFLKIINDDNFDKSVYNELIEKYGFRLVDKYFSKYITNNMSDDSYEKCKYYLEDDISNSVYENNNADLDGLTQYLNEIGRYKLLDPKEEREILIRLDELKVCINDYKTKYNINKIIESYGKDFDNINSLNDKNIQIIKDYLELQKEFDLLSNKLIEANLRLVISVARHYENANIELLDLIQEGNIGIKDAIKKFDINRGNKFSTYAVWWIRQHIVREIHENSRTIKIPVHKHELLYKIKKANILYEKEFGDKATKEELIEFIKTKVEEGVLKNCKSFEKLTIEVLDELEKINQNMISINNKIGEDEGSTIEDLIADENEESVETIVQKKVISDDIKSVLNEISSRYKLIIILRFGFSLRNYMDYEEFLSCFNELKYSEKYYKKLYIRLCQNQITYTLEQIANMYELTRERIRQMEAKALRTIRIKNNRKRILKPDSLELYK